MMGAAVARQQPRTSRRHVPHLALVGSARTRPAKRGSQAAQAAAARDLFTAFAVFVVVVSVLGVGRVWLSVQAAEASIKANELRSTIKSERYEGDMLEVRQSALGSPSRIRAIASNALQMTSSRKVTYVRLETGAVAPQAPRPAPVVSNSNGAMARMMDLTAGEAQVLLVGSIGLARSK